MVKEEKMENQIKTSATREKILEAAIEEFIEYGFYGARTRGIAGRAGVNNAMIHYYFRNKEKIYEECLESVVTILLDRLNKIGDKYSDPKKKIEDIMDAYIDLLGKNMRYIRLVLYDVIRGGKIIRNIFLKNIHKIPFNPMNGKIYKYFKDQMNKGKIRRLDIFQLIISIITQIVPVYIAAEIFTDVGKYIGLKKSFVQKIISKRKKFVIDILINGIKSK
jgi:AcrR family transcriptional regulator